MEEWKEFSAKTSDEALTNALIQMETTSDQIEYEIIEEEKSGILGLFSKPARIRVRKKQTAEGCARSFLEQLFSVMNLVVEVIINYDEAESIMNIELKGNEMGMLIGKIKIDTENYRQRRKDTIENLAKNVANKVKKTGRPAFLEPMNPYERRIIHSALQSDKYVDTHSEGEEPMRKVVITLNREYASELPRRNNYKKRNNYYSKDRKKSYSSKRD